MNFGPEVSQFSSITGLDAEQSRFFVESAGGNLQTALGTFYETVGDTNLGAPTLVGGAAGPAVQAPAPPATGPQTLGGQSAEALPEAWRRGGSIGGSAGNSGRSTPRAGVTGLGDLQRPSENTRSGPGRIATLKDIGGGSIDGLPPALNRDGDSDEEDEGQPPTDGPPNLYAGGGTSGLNVQDPKRQGTNKPKRVISDILKKATEAGPNPFDHSSAPAPSGPRVFGGTAHTLGSDDTPSRMVPDANARLVPSSQFPTALPVPGRYGDEEDEEGDDDDEVERHLTFWKDGFSIEDGPLLRYDEPKNKEILDAINAGRAPLDLLNVKFNQRVTMRVQRRLHEDYVPPPKKPAVPFSGAGNRLGSPMPARMGDTPSPAAVLPPSAGGSGPVAGSGAEVRFAVDQSLPVTSVQIRLGDGSRMVTRFNHTHTVGDIRRQIQASNPALATRRYVLQTTFPSRDLTNDAQTIKDAGLAGSVVVQRFV